MPDFELEVQQLREQLAEEVRRDQECERGEHTPHPLWAWRCEHCMGLLCTGCGEEVDRCECRRPR
jgi:hypothetical protein